MKWFSLGVAPLALFAGPLQAQQTETKWLGRHPVGFYKSEPSFEPGPFVIFFDEGDTSLSEGAEQILDNAFARWPETNFPRFVLCYDPADETEAGGEIEAARKATVRAELIRRGAEQVLDSVWDCYHRDEPLQDTRARMAMVGVLEMDEPPLQSD